MILDTLLGSPLAPFLPAAALGALGLLILVAERLLPARSLDPGAPLGSLLELGALSGPWIGAAASAVVWGESKDPGRLHDSFAVAGSLVVLGALFFTLLLRLESDTGGPPRPGAAAPLGARSEPAALLLSTGAFLIALRTDDIATLFAALESGRLLLWAARPAARHRAGAFLAEGFLGAALVFGLVLGARPLPAAGALAGLPSAGFAVLLGILCVGAALGPVLAALVSERGTEPGEDIRSLEPVALFRAAVLPIVLLLVAHRVVAWVPREADPELRSVLVFLLGVAAIGIAAVAGIALVRTAGGASDEGARTIGIGIGIGAGRALARISLLVTALAGAAANPESSGATVALFIGSIHHALVTIAPSSARPIRAELSTGSFATFIVLLAAAGAPGTIGFWARWLVLRESARCGLWILVGLGLAVWMVEGIAALTGRDEPVETRTQEGAPRASTATFVATLAAIVALAVGLFPASWWSFVEEAARTASSR